MSRQLQPSVPLVTLVKTESPAVIRNEPPEEALEKDIKNIDIVYHSLSEDLIKSETVAENILETKYSESVETQVLVKIEDTSDENVTRGTGQEVIEVQGSKEYSNVLGNLESNKQLVIYFSKDLNSFSTKNRKAKQPEKTNFAKCYKTVETISWKKDKEEIKVMKAPVIPVEAHEYTSLGKGKYVCNHCQHAYNALSNLRQHIKRMHRKFTTTYQCPYCSYKSKWSVKQHIILKHKNTKDIQWFQCHLCEKKFKLKGLLIEHMKVHLRHKQMKDVLDLRKKRYGCNKCNYKTYASVNLKNHKLTHLKPEEVQYFYCYHCSYKAKHKKHLKEHIFRNHFKNVIQAKRYGCNKCDYETHYRTYLKRHNLVHLKPEEIQYFYCYHCSYKTKWKEALQKHIFTHFKKEQIKFDCYICNFMTQKRESIIAHIKKHSRVQIKFEIND